MRDKQAIANLRAAMQDVLNELVKKNDQIEALKRAVDVLIDTPTGGSKSAGTWEAAVRIALAAKEGLAA